MQTVNDHVLGPPLVGRDLTPSPAVRSRRPQHVSHAWNENANDKRYVNED